MKRIKTDGIIVHRAEVVSGRDYHFLIERAGTIRAMVPQDDVGEHAYCYNKTTLGIAVFGDFASAEKGRNHYATPAQVETCLSLVRTLQGVYGKLWVTGHSNLGLRGTRYLQKLVAGHTCPGENFPLDYIIDESGALPFPVQVAGVKVC